MPAMSCSLYTILSDVTLEEMHSTLENAGFEEHREVYGETFTLRNFISELHWGTGREALWGTLAFEILQPIRQIDGRPTFVKAGSQVRFSVFPGAMSSYLLTFSNRRRAERTAIRINHILTEDEEEPDLVFNCRIPTAAIEEFLLNHPHIKKMSGWRDLNIPGINKSSLYGPDLDQSEQTQLYDEHGRKRYIMVELPAARMTVRISEQGIITFYRNITNPDALAWIRREIIPLLV